MNSAHDDQKVAMNFSWLEPDRIAGCRGPRTYEDLQFLYSVGIRALVRLAYEKETGMSAADVAKNGIEDCYEPVEDWTAPPPDQVKRVVRFIRQCAHDGKPTAVSCNAGYGRTGTILACYLVSLGNSAEDSIQELIRRRPCSSELLKVEGQPEAIHDFQTALRGLRGAPNGN
jgi:atypical dual specificity phosphatase